MKRLSVSHPKYSKIQTDLYNGKAGFGGEREFDYHLREFTPDYPYAILHDLYLKQDQFYFQLDSLLITPGFIVLFEIKNIAGKLHIKQNPTQFIRESSAGERTVLRSPIEELERKKFYLAGWLKQLGIQIPLVDYVVFAYHNELNIENMEANRIVFSYEVPNKLRNLQQETEVLDERQLHMLANKLVKAHRSYEPPALIDRYELSESDVAAGVTCRICNRLTMQWMGRKWRCQACGYRDAGSHLNALAEWYSIRGAQLTNREFRQFCRIQSRHVAKHLLANRYTELHGNTRNCVYHLSSNLLSLPHNLSL